jgi:hypothetical protein
MVTYIICYIMYNGDIKAVYSEIRSPGSIFCTKLMEDR